MRLPILRARSSKELAVPELFGGLNKRDSVSMVNDNQLTECLNMWKNDGTLKTRPGVCTDTVFEIPNKLEPEVEGYKTFAGENVTKHNIFKDGVNGKMQLCSIPCKDAESGNYTKIYFVFVGADNIDYEALKPKEFEADNGIGSYFIAEKDGEYYLYTNNQQIFKYADVENNTASWERVSEEDYYVPLVLAHCKPLSNTGGVSKEKVFASGTMIEGFNSIGNRYRMVYSTVDADLLSDTITSHAMVYTLLYSTHTSKYQGKKVIARLSNASGTVVEHTVTLSGSSEISYESDYQSDGLKMRVVAQVVSFLRESDGKTATVTADDFVEDNLEIEAPYITTTEEKKRVFSMTRCEWFGGDSSGLAGGTRLFLCNNRNKKLKGLVTWSGLNDPTYFPENSYFYVGNNTEKVTGFGKQQDMLVIFKERETWYTQYERNTDITAEDLINQTVVDYTSSSVYFPLTQINPNIGCPYPESVQLCRNRLVWLGYNGAVHTLVSNNQYNERSIYTVSGMVQRKLREETKGAVSSADWNGYYCLSFDNKLYLMDYNCYGFNYISSYSKTEDANIQIPWYYWELPDCEIKGKSPLISVDDNLGFVGYVEGAKVLNDEVRRSFFDTSLLCDELLPNDGGDKAQTPINCHFTTKLFEFGAPHVRKNVERINLQLGNNGAEPIYVSLITESGTEEQMIVLDGNEAESYSPAFIDSKAVFPCIRNVLRLGIELSCSGPMAVDGIILQYRFTGGGR